MARGNNLQIANFTCKYGEKDLLDIPGIFYRVFFNREKVRQYKDSKYILRDVDMLNFRNVDFVVAGRFVKDLFLHREQVYVEGEGVVSNPGKMQSSPSALFFLFLNNHRLLYYHESSFAPKLGIFESTIRWFFKDERKKVINRILADDDLREKRSKRYGQRVTRALLNKKIPEPDIEIIPLSSVENLRSFVNRFSVLKSVKVTFFRTNNELDTDALFRAIREQGDILGRQRTVLDHSSKEGLDKDGVVEQFGELGTFGNSEMFLRGVDDKGDRLSGNNEDFQVKIPIDSLPKNVSDAARQVYAIYSDLKDKDSLGKTLSSDGDSEKLIRFVKGIDERRSK